MGWLHYCKTLFLPASSISSILKFRRKFLKKKKKKPLINHLKKKKKAKVLQSNQLYFYFWACNWKISWLAIVKIFASSVLKSCIEIYLIGEIQIVARLDSEIFFSGKCMIGEWTYLKFLKELLLIIKKSIYLKKYICCIWYWWIPDLGPNTNLNSDQHWRWFHNFIRVATQLRMSCAIIRIYPYPPTTFYIIYI